MSVSTSLVLSVVEVVDVVSVVVGVSGVKFSANKMETVFQKNLPGLIKIRLTRSFVYTLNFMN